MTCFYRTDAHRKDTHADFTSLPSPAPAQPKPTRTVALPRELTWQYALGQAHDRYWRGD